MKKRVNVYQVWDVPTRFFHWITVIVVVLLVLSGLLILNRKVFEIHSSQAKLALKAAHASIGYLLVASLGGRIAWGFWGNRHARWRALLPNRQSLAALRPELEAMIAGRPHRYLGHAPASRLSGSLLLLCLLVSVVTGLVRAGTDLYYPPFGYAVASYLAKPEVEASSLLPGDSANVDDARYQRIRPAKLAFGKVHLYSTYTLLVLVGIHITGIVLSEVRQRSGLVSAMFSGEKTFDEDPLDLDESSDDEQAG